MGLHTPPVICEHVEDAQHDNQKWSRPLGLKTNGNHDAGDEANKRHHDANEAPLTLKHESDEEKNKKDTTSKEDAEQWY